MADEDYGRAVQQLSALESFKYLGNVLPDPPVSMPQDRFGAAGVAAALWYGLGIVGVWAAIDAFAERNAKTKHRGGFTRLTKHVPPSLVNIVLELDDLRNLFGHNFAGVADRKYLEDKVHRHCLKWHTPYVLSCGYPFKGLENEQIVLTLDHFLFYIASAREILLEVKE